MRFNKISVRSGKIDTPNTSSVVGEVKAGTNTATASAALVGVMRYRTTATAAFLEVCIQNGAATYIWKTVVTEDWA